MLLKFVSTLTVLLTVSAVAQTVIITQPRNQSVPEGGATTLFVQAEDGAGIAYQWFFTSTNNAIPNATNATLVISNASPAMEGNYYLRLSQGSELVWSQAARLTLFQVGLSPFGTITLPPAFVLNGAGTDVDSIAFWDAPNPTNTLMFVTGKGNDTLEVWQYPFQGNERPSRSFPANINGVAVDQENDLLYVSDRIVSVFSLPALQLQHTFGQGIIGVGENNLAILKQTNRTLIYVSDDHRVHRFDAATTNYLGFFAPPVSSIETLAADDLNQLILVPEEQGPLGNPGVYAYHPDGAPYLKNGTNRFGGTGIFDSDEEGILLYTFPSTGPGDNGAGFIVVTDQKSDVTDFEFFDRKTWAHLGTLRLQGVSNTDGIASTQQPLPAYPLGLFAAINNDTTTTGLGWDVIFHAIGYKPQPRVIRITPASTTITRGQDLAFTIEFNEAVTNFNNADDLVVTQFGATNTGVTISGSNTLYQVTLTGIAGRGSLVLAVNVASDIQNLAGESLASSLASLPIVVQSPYDSWAADQGLTSGVNSDYFDDPDNDSASNLEEFATNRDPLQENELIKERLIVSEVDGQTYLTLTFPVRTGAVFAGTEGLSGTVDDINYNLSGGMDITEFNSPIVEIAPALTEDLPLLDDGWTYRTFGLQTPFDDPSSGFIRRIISLLP